MKYLIVWILGCALLAINGKMPPDIPQTEPEKEQFREGCKKIREEFMAKIKEIRANRKESLKQIRDSHEGEKKDCWKENKGNIDAIRGCILAKKQQALNKLEKVKTIIIQALDNIIATIDTYKDKLKTCKVKAAEFKERRKVKTPEFKE